MAFFPIVDLVLLAALGLLAAILATRLLPSTAAFSRRSAQREVAEGLQTSTARFRPKPEWVRPEVLRLKALGPDLSCRKLADLFNHLHYDASVSIGKTFVSDALRGRSEDIKKLRTEMRRRVPKPLPRHVIWGLDLTFVSDPAGTRTVFGLIDHGTRFCLAMSELPRKTSFTILRALLDAFEAFGLPRAIRTDNEPVFRSLAFCIALNLLGIRHQRTAPYAPWQNGRIERFFGTFKERYRSWLAAGGTPDELGTDLATFRGWYNHARPHQHLGGDMPAMRWFGFTRDQIRESLYVSEWSGALSGFVMRR